MAFVQQDVQTRDFVAHRRDALEGDLDRRASRDRQRPHRWVDADPNNIFVRIVREPTDPLMRLVRPLARKIPGPIDWSPAIVLLGLELISRLLIAIFH